MDSKSGGWTLEWQGLQVNYEGATSILEGVKQLSSSEIIYDPKAEGLASHPDYAIVVVGETPYAEFFGDVGDGTGEHQLILNQEHRDYIKAYSNGFTKIIVVLISGRPMVVTEQIEASDAFVAAWLPGSEGLGVAEVLFGKYNFKGKLPHSWPKSLNDFDGKYGPNYWDKTIEPLYELGYGLEY